MIETFYTDSAARWLADNSDVAPEKVVKPTAETSAWFARIAGREVFAKWYPPALREAWAKVETAIAGGNLHPAIVPLRQVVHGDDGDLLLYDRVRGDNLGPQAVRGRFQALPVGERAAVVVAVANALAAICEAGFMIVDWYEGNMIYDFDACAIWLFDWELCREGSGFMLEMDANYGSSRLMAPEEFVRGSRLDQSTLVFNLGRYALLTLPDLADPLAPLLARATYPARAGRFGTVREFSTPLGDALAALLPAV